VEEAGSSRAQGLGLTQTVRAAGGVVARRRQDGEVEVVVVHRPKYDDWTFPKGKALRGESDEACAVREVEEETGLVCELVHELGATTYRDSRGREKRVRYWAMRPVGGRFAGTGEVDVVRWLPPAEAGVILSYDRDLEVLASFLATPV
jgi:8-oxo-dGTP pyrophosphatase MutT (NUDIX family)